MTGFRHQQLSIEICLTPSKVFNHGFEACLNHLGIEGVVTRVRARDCDFAREKMGMLENPWDATLH